MKVAIIGTVGVPACYGGFETLVENLIGEYKSPDIEYTVFCSGKSYSDKKDYYKGAKLKYIPFNANGLESMIYDFISLIKSMRKYDIILYLGSTIPVYRWFKKLCKGKIINNIDGLSQTRDKYSTYQQRYIAYLLKNEIEISDVIVADNKGMQDYVMEHFGAPSKLIAYGGDQAIVDMTDEEENDILGKYNLQNSEYSIGVCRIEPENNCHLILEAFKRTGKTIIYIGNWDNSEYGRELKRQYANCDNIKMQSPIYDLRTLYALRKNASRYIHGHKVGGTNPSLVEAMFFGNPIACFDVVYNRATTFGKADYFHDIDSLMNILNNNENSGEILKSLAYENYTWQRIVKLYEEAYQEALQK